MTRCFGARTPRANTAKQQTRESNMILSICYTMPTYLARQTCANSAGPDETPYKRRILSGSTLLATNSAIFKHVAIGSKLSLFKF